MAANTVFIINNTVGTPIAAIQPNTLNGPGGVQQSSDLAMFGLGYATWGQASDENDFRLLENFACPQSVINPSPVQPMGEAELGAGNGINVPLVGQLWFNTTAQAMYVNTATGWQTITLHSIVVPSGAVNPSPVPSIGALFFNTGSNQLLISNGLVFESIAANYLPLAGGTMTGDINMGNNNIVAANNVTTSAVNASYYRAANGIASNQITIPVDGATSFVDGPRIGPYVIIHTGNASFLNNFVTGMIMGWRSPVPPSGWAICDGTLGTPDLRNRFIIGAGGTYASGGTYGSLAPLTLTINSTAAGVTGSHTLALTEMPAHHHAILYAQGSQSSGSGAHYTDLFGLGYQNTIQAGPAVGEQIIQDTGGGLGHTHTIPAYTYSGTVTPVIPPAYGLFWIMKL